MPNPDNVIIYAEEWATKVQEELDEPVKWKEICRVEYTDVRVLNNPYLTDATVQTGARGTPYTFQAVTETNESVTISTFKILPQLIDRADLAQSTFMRQMELAERQGVLLNESIESAVYADYTNWTVFDNAAIGGPAGSLTVSATNVDDIIRAMKREIREANGESLANRNGIFIVWRPAEFEILEAFVQANGFSTADAALKAGTSQGFQYMGISHYTSNLLSGGHLFGGVKKTHHLGILRVTYGQIMVDDKDPDRTSGVSVVSRVDYGVKTWTRVKPVLFDIRVAI